MPNVFIRNLFLCLLAGQLSVTLAVALPPNPPNDSAGESPGPSPDSDTSTDDQESADGTVRAQRPVSEPQEPHSAAEQIVQIRREIERNQQRLEELKRQRVEVGTEYEQAEEELTVLQEQLDAAGQEYELARRAGQLERSNQLERDVRRLTRARELARERFDLAIDQRQTIDQQIITLEQIVARENDRLDELRGTGPEEGEPSPEVPLRLPPPQPEADRPAEAPEHPAAQFPPSLRIPPLFTTEPDTERESFEPPEDVATQEDESEEVRRAEAEAEETAQALMEQERLAAEIEERLEYLDRSIALERTLLETAQRIAANARETRFALSQEFRDQSLSGQAQPEELQAMQVRIRELESRDRAAREEVGQRIERLDQLQEVRAVNLKALTDAQAAVERSRAQLQQAEAHVQRLRNPFATHNVQQWLLDHGLTILGILVVMFLLHWMVTFFSGRTAQFLVHRSKRGALVEREARSRTLVNVFRNAASLLILIGGTLMVLDEAGVPVAPLLGGAAVLGLAIAFGAQNLMRDFFYGFMILLENQYKLNDVVTIGEHTGQVEQITLRMTALRDLHGNCHFIPNGEIDSVVNLSHTWSRALFDIGVAYKENVDRVIEVLMELATEMQYDRKFGPLILEEPQMLGVNEFADSAVVIRFYIKTAPLQQWSVRRELLRRIKNRFDELGIEIPYPHRTVFHRGANGLDLTPAMMTGSDDRVPGSNGR